MDLMSKSWDLPTKKGFWFPFWNRVSDVSQKLVSHKTASRRKFRSYSVVPLICIGQVCLCFIIFLICLLSFFETIFISMNNNFCHLEFYKQIIKRYFHMERKNIKDRAVAIIHAEHVLDLSSISNSVWPLEHYWSWWYPCTSEF